MRRQRVRRTARRRAARRGSAAGPGRRGERATEGVLEHCALADYGPARPQSLVGRLDDEPVLRTRCRRIERRGRRRADSRDPAPTRCSTRSTRASTRRSSTRASPPGVTYLDMAMTLSEPHPEHPTRDRGQARRRRSSRARSSGRRRPLALVGIGVEPGALGRVRPLRRRPPLLRDRRDRRPRRRQPRRRGLRLRADVLDLDDDRGVPQPAGDLGEGTRLVHDGAVLRTRGVRLPRGHRPGRVRQRRARGGAARAAVDRLRAGDVQVRARRRVHRRAEDAAQARPRLEGARSASSGVEVAPRDVVAAALPDPASSASG